MHLLTSLLLTLALHALSPATPAPTLGTRGTQLTVGGSPQFVVLVSYFDALDASRLSEDLRYLAGRVDGIRIFPNWWDWDPKRKCRARWSDRTLLTMKDGAMAIRPDRLDRLKAVLREARKAGLIVDVTFTYETVRGLSRLQADADGLLCGTPNTFRNEVNLEAYARGLEGVAAALDSQEFDHVFFDLQNEIANNWTRLNAAQVRVLAGAVRNADPQRLVTVSDFQPDASKQAAVVKTADLDLLVFHDWPRSEGWPARTADHVRTFRRALDAAGLQVPILDGEPPPESDGRGAEAFRASLAGAREAGAAGWTFHTRASFRLDEASLASLLDPDARAFLDDLASARRTGGAAAGGGGAGN